ncbi:hypothetical protein QBC39DRAFT_362518 [Podospora conica]|nr:hypothetical protein QBC39DRAFT_362518 [Schizothecium conicum]
MHCIRRAALRATLSASRQVSSKAVTAPSMAISALKVAASVQSPIIASRCFSQTARVQEEGNESRGGRGQEPMVGNESEHGIFVRNISFDLNAEQLKAAFERFGNVTGAQVARDARGMSRGYAFVYFETAEAKTTAITEVDGSFWHGRRVNVLERTKTARTARDQSENVPSDVLFIGNIPYDATDAELTRIFRELPNVADIRVAVDRTTGWPRGFAHLTFPTVEDATVARAKLEGTEIHGRELRVNYSVGKFTPEKKFDSDNGEQKNVFGEN